jgi:ABC-type transport system involved in cytochrome c biogenesis permease subunit
VLIGRYPPADSLPHVLLDPKILMTLLVWLVFGFTLLVRQVIKLEGRRLVLFWMSGFALTIVSMTLVNAFGTQFHSFM